MRRRRLNAYQRSGPWPGKDIALRSELARYDRFLVMAAEMLQVTAPALLDGDPFPPEARAALEDRLAVAGLDVFAPRNGTGDVVADGDLWI